MRRKLKNRETEKRKPSKPASCRSKTSLIYSAGFGIEFRRKYIIMASSHCQEVRPFAFLQNHGITQLVTFFLSLIDTFYCLSLVFWSEILDLTHQKTRLPFIRRIVHNAVSGCSVSPPSPKGPQYENSRDLFTSDSSLESENLWISLSSFRIESMLMVSNHCC